MDKNNVYKASSVDLAIRNGLADLGLTEETADIEIISQGGIFAKATVRITPKVTEEVGMEEVVTEEIAEEETAAPETEETSAREEAVEESAEKRESRFAEMKALRDVGKEFLKEIARLTGANVNIEGKVKDDEICFYISGDDARTFIGYKGETLEAVQTGVSHYINKDREERYRVVVDADFYRERRKKTLVALAKKLAKQAYNQHREIALEPMNSYERRIIHSALQDSDEATTRSDGEGKDRHIVVVPKSGTMTYGNSASFRRNGPAKTKSYGYDKRRF